MRVQSGAEIWRELQRNAKHGAYHAAWFLARRVRETVNEKAPVRMAAGGPRALTPAIAGKPPRRVSGELQKRVRVVPGLNQIAQAELPSFTGKWNAPVHAGGGGALVRKPISRGGWRVQWRIICSAASPKGFHYGAYLEENNHPFIDPTVWKWRRVVERIIGAEIARGA